MSDSKIAAMVEALSLWSPSCQARMFAHRNGLPWEKVAALESLLASTINPAIESLTEHEQIMVEHELFAMDSAFECCGSPIEELFLAYMAPGYPEWNWVEDTIARRYDGVTVELQCPVEKYKLDFAIVTPSLKVAIELDGHEWHERNKSQAAKDKSRDRRLQELDWKVLRFTGSEVWADPRKCVREAFRIAGLA